MKTFREDWCLDSEALKHKPSMQCFRRDIIYLKQCSGIKIEGQKKTTKCRETI
jgi:hypothetical protein